MTPEEQVIEVLTDYFESQALDCSIASIHLCDTIREPFTRKNPEYQILQRQLDSLNKLLLEAITRKNKTARDRLEKETYSLLEAQRQIRDEWVGKPLYYTYRVIVKCSDYQMKMDIEDYLYKISLDYSELIGLTTPELLEYEQNREDLEEMNKLLNNLKRYR